MEMEMLAVALEATLEVCETEALYGVVLSHKKKRYNVEYHIHTIFRFVHAAHTRSSADDASDAQ